MIIYQPKTILKKALDSFLGRSTARGALNAIEEMPVAVKQPHTRMRRSAVAPHLRGFPDAADRAMLKEGLRFRDDRFTWARHPGRHVRPAYAKLIEYARQVTFKDGAGPGGPRLVPVVRHRYLHATKGWRDYAVVPLGIQRA